MWGSEIFITSYVLQRHVKDSSFCFSNSWMTFEEAFGMLFIEARDVIMLFIEVVWILILYIYIGVKQSLVFKLWVLESEKKSMLFWGLRSSNLFGDSHFLCTAICQCKILLLYFLYTSYQSFSLCSTNSHKFSFFFFFLLLLFSYMWIQKMTWASSDCSLILDF